VSNPLFLAPNQITLLRLIFIPFIVINVLEGTYIYALVLFVLAGLSDALDGTLARLLKQKSTLGQYLDPIADKLLLSTLFLVLSLQQKIPWKFTVLVFSRDLCILVTAAVLYAVTSLRDFRPSVFGKANTVAQVGAIFFVLLSEIYSEPVIWYAGRLLLWVTLVLTIVSGLHYVVLAGQRTAQQDKGRTTAAR